MSEVGKGKITGQIMIWNGVRQLWFPDLFPAPVAPSPGSLLTWTGAGNQLDWIINAPGLQPGPSTLDLSGQIRQVWGADTTLGSVTFILPPRSNQLSGVLRAIKDVAGTAATNPIFINVGVMFNGTQGTSNGTTTYTDPAATFQSVGIATGDFLVVQTGPGAGTYQVTGVLSQTQLTVATPVPADPGPATYNITDRNFEDGSFTLTIDGDFGSETLYYIPNIGWRRFDIGPEGKAEDVIEFSFTDTGVIVLTPVMPGSVLSRADISVETPFDAVGATVSLGTIASPNLILGPGDTKLQQASGQFQNLEIFKFLVPDTLILTVTPSGSVQGKCILLYELS